jgi:hypothetical protein
LSSEQEVHLSGHRFRLDVAALYNIQADEIKRQKIYILARYVCMNEMSHGILLFLLVVLFPVVDESVMEATCVYE